jgi:RNA polymerase sigma factor (sigma-70 family)
MNKTYEDKSDELEELLNKYKAKWQLNALAWLDYDDVCQIIRLHIYKKWHLWDQERPFKPWAAMIISNQIKNLIRNNYSNFAKPCLRCPHNLGNNMCAITKIGEQNEECEIFAKWKKKKEKAYNLKLPITLDDSISLGTSNIEDNFNYLKSAEFLHDLILDQLNDKHKTVYIMLFIEHKEEQEVADFFKFKADKAKRKNPRYKQITNLKKKFYLLAAKILKENDIL